MSTRYLAIIAIQHAAHVMNNVDPDDRTFIEQDLVSEVKAMMRRANDGDVDSHALLIAAVPEWDQEGEMDVRDAQD